MSPRPRNEPKDRRSGWCENGDYWHAKCRMTWCTCPRHTAASSPQAKESAA